MRLKRTLTEAEFAAAVRHLKAPSKLALALAHADLVQGIDQAKVGERHDRSKGAVCAASRRVWRGFLLSWGYEEVTAVLTEA